MRKRRSKALERLAREITSNETFVEHVLAINANYREHRAADVSEGARELRQCLRQFERHAAALCQWLERGQRDRGNWIEREGFELLTASFADGSASARQQSVAVRLWLEHASRAVPEVIANLRDRPRRAPERAADAIRATFEHHKLKLSTRTPPHKEADSIRLLCAMAKDAGDELTPKQARAAFASARKQAI